MRGTAVRLGFLSGIGVIVLVTNVVAGCDQLGDKLGIGNRGPVDDGAPGEQELHRIQYMSSADSGPKGRKVYNALEQAKSCEDLELALRWNRPPNIEGGPFHKKLVYVTDAIPPELPKQAEVFIKGRIDRAAMLPTGSAGWLLRMSDGSSVQAVEAANFWEKQQQDSQEGKAVALVKPTKPGRAFCGQGVYQGLAASDPAKNTHIPLVAMLFSMDRDK